MELSSLEQFTKEELPHLNLNDMPSLIGLLTYQERLFNLYYCFNHGQIENEKFLKDSTYLEVCVLKIINSTFDCPKLLEKFIKPIRDYITYIAELQQRNSLSFEQRMKIIKVLYGKYEEIRNSCLLFKEQADKAYIKSIVEETKQTVPILRKKRHLISKEEFGYNNLYTDFYFLNFLHNICRTLETQGYLAEIIVFIHLKLQQLSDAFIGYKEQILHNDCLEINPTSENDPSPTPDYAIKKPKSIEGYYISHIVSSFSKDHTAFEKFGAFALSLINHQNSEVKNFAALALAKSTCDRILDQYVKLITIFLKIYNQDPVIYLLEKSYHAISQMTDDNLKKSIQFLPSALFKFAHHSHQANIHFNETAFPKKLNAINVLIAHAEEFLNEFSANKETYVGNYKRLKDTLRSLVTKCPSSQLYTMHHYLKECSLAPYCLDTIIKNHILSNEQIKLISKLRQETLIDASDTPENDDNIKEIPVRKQRTTKGTLHKKKRSRRRKNQKKRKQSLPASRKETSSKQEISETVALCLDQNQAKSENIHLADKKIARKIIDVKNNMTIYVYRMNGNDPSAGKHINYDDRVQQWFSTPEKALAEKKYTESDPRRETSIAFHSFSEEINRYALKWGFKRKTQNNYGKNVTEIHLPGIIEKDGNSYEGLFVYVIDIKLLCYHRFFHSCDWHKKLVEEWQVDFKE